MTDRLLPGTQVRCASTKWPDRPHWEFDTVYLGADDHGDWLGLAPDTLFTRPGMEFRAGNWQVTLVPYDAWWSAGFHGAGDRKPWQDLGDAPVDVYCDIATPSLWHGATVSYVDLDLDVVRGTNGRVIVADEDEFEVHRRDWGYPADVVAAAQESCEVVRRLIETRTPPFDGATAAGWLARLA